MVQSLWYWWDDGLHHGLLCSGLLHGSLCHGCLLYSGLLHGSLCHGCLLCSGLLHGSLCHGCLSHWSVPSRGLLRNTCMGHRNLVTKLLYHTMVPGRAGGGSFRGKNTIGQTKNLTIDCAQGHQPVSCPNRIFARTRLQPFRLVVVLWWWLVAFPWCVGGGDAMCCGVMWYDVRWFAAR